MRERKRERRERERRERKKRVFSPFAHRQGGEKHSKQKNTKKNFQAKLSRNEVLWIQRVFSGETLKGRTPSLQEACAPGGKAPLALPTLEEFRHLTAVVASYAFHLPDDEGTDRTVMLPLLDLVNHANAGVANAVVAREGEEFTARALRDIREGEEVSFFPLLGPGSNVRATLLPGPRKFESHARRSSSSHWPHSTPEIK